MERFKKGTKVVCVDGFTAWDLKTGGIYTIGKCYENNMVLLEGDITIPMLSSRFIPVSEIEPFAVIAENWDQCREIIAYWRSIFEGCPTEEGFEHTGGMKRAVQSGKVTMYFKTNVRSGYGWDSSGYSGSYYNGIKTLTFEQFKNNEHIMNTKQQMKDFANKAKQEEEELVVSPDFVKEAHKVACATWKKKIEDQFPSLFPNVVFKVGEKVRIGCTEYIISCVDDNLYNLISLTDGNRFCDPFRVNNSKSITEKELKQNFLCGETIVKI